MSILNIALAIFIVTTGIGGCAVFIAIAYAIYKYAKY